MRTCIKIFSKINPNEIRLMMSDLLGCRHDPNDDTYLDVVNKLSEAMQLTQRSSTVAQAKPSSIHAAVDRRGIPASFIPVVAL